MKKIFLALVMISNCYGTTLVLIGGGKRPQSALSHFVSKVKSGPIYVLPWGTRYPQESFDTIKSELKDVGAGEVKCFCSDAFTQQDRLKLERAGGIYFPGGNQNKVMAKIIDLNLKNKLIELFQKNIPFAGTSAGTAIQSELMLTGRGSETTVGLGLLKRFIVDQHFIVRNREDRLLGAIKNHDAYNGLGVDEDMSAVVTGGEIITALGPTQVLLYIKNKKMIQKIELSDKESFKLSF
tara:strand:+ start:213276 stop:213989 length:714 start_codon:yes stop_codon:yes gene_type:complete